ncbi:unnamed protein product, partial [Heterotrigona itama]
SFFLSFLVKVFVRSERLRAYGRYHKGLVAGKSHASRRPVVGMTMAPDSRVDKTVDKEKGKRIRHGAECQKLHTFMGEELAFARQLQKPPQHLSTN